MGPRGLLWLPQLGAGAGPASGTALSHECRVSSWLGASSLSRGWPASLIPAHSAPGTTTPTIPGREQEVGASAGAGPGTSPLPPAAGGWGPRRAPGSVRAPVSPLHLQTAPSRGAARRKQPPPRLNGSFLAPAAATKGSLWREGPGGRALASSPLRWAPASPPPGRGVPPASPTAMGGEDGPTGSEAFREEGSREGGDERASSVVMGARLGLPGWQWGAPLRGQESCVSPPAQGGLMLVDSHTPPCPGFILVLQ